MREADFYEFAASAGFFEAQAADDFIVIYSMLIEKPARFRVRDYVLATWLDYSCNEDLTVEEIAQRHDTSPRIVEQRISRVKSIVKGISEKVVSHKLKTM